MEWCKTTREARKGRFSESSLSDVELLWLVCNSQLTCLCLIQIHCNDYRKCEYVTAWTKYQLENIAHPNVPVKWWAYIGGYNRMYLSNGLVCCCQKLKQSVYICTTQNFITLVRQDNVTVKHEDSLWVYSVYPLHQREQKTIRKNKKEVSYYVF